MALNYDLGAIRDYEAVCFLEAPADEPMSGVTKGDRVMNPVTNVLIWATIAVDLPGITEENAAEFFARLRFTEQNDGPFLIRAEVDGVRPSGSDAYVTEEEVRVHIGLTCNVTPLTRTAWLNKMKQSFDRDLDRYADRFDKKREEARVA